MGFWSWLTGRDEKESDVYANFDKVEVVVSNLKKIATDNVSQANDAVRAAINELNTVKGMAEYVGQLEVNSFDGTFEAVESTINQIATTMEQKANDIKIYEEASWLEKLGSTVFMAGAKLGEGVLSVVEDLGDGIVSIVGWVAPKDSGVEQWCSDFVQKEWSHDVFNFYYESDFAKKSTFTEDSAIAGGIKIAGKVATYLFAGGYIAGAGSASAGAVVNAAKAGGKVAGLAAKGITAASRVASASTWGATALAGITGMGSSTENALLNGAESFDAAAREGAKGGATQAALAFVGGKVSEGMQWRAGGKTGKWSDYQGYNDAISTAGRNVGYNATQNIITNGIIKGTAMNAGAVVNAGKTAITQGGQAVVRTVTQTVAHPVQAVKNIAGTAVNAVKSAPGAVVTVAKAAIQNPGVLAQTANAAFTNAQASENIGYGQPSVELAGPIVENPSQGTPVGQEIPKEQQFRMEGVEGGGNNPNVGPTGSYPTGGGPSGSTGGNPGTTTPGDTGTTTPGDTGITTPGDTGTTTPGDTGYDGGYTGPGSETSGGDTTHSGGGFGNDEFSGTPFEIDEGFMDEGDEFDSLADIIANGDKLTEIPSSSTPIKANSNGGGSAVIPIAAGLSAAAAAGIGAKVYMDKKNNADNGEDDEFETDDWSDEDQIEIDYEESEGSIADQYLKDEDDYGYQARSNEELADLQ